MTPDTRAEGFVAGTRKIVQILRYGPRELGLALLGFLLLGAIPLLPKLAEPLPFLRTALPWLNGVLAVLGVFLLAFAAWRIWKKAVAPLPEAKPKPAAIKGPAPFGPQDAELFARLGRNDDLNRLRDWILDDQKPLVALMGESGVGKTSLLRAGLAHHLQEDKIPVLYWEAVPTEPESKLLHAMQELWEERQKALKTFDGLASIVASSRRVVVIDQAEQLSPEGHPRIFDLLRKVAEGNPPYQATWVVAFRREFLPVWRDFELGLPEAVQRRMETLSLQRFPPKAAEKVIAVLVEEGSLPVDQKLVEELVESVAFEGKVSPADIGISLLVLSELAGGRPDRALSLVDFRESGGQAGLLTRYLERLLELFPESERPEVLRGLLTLLDLEKDQRLAEGRTLVELEEVVKPASPPRLVAALRFLASGKARVLEELPGEPVRYRLVHERLIPAIRTLTGVLLAGAERASLTLDRGYRVWAQDRQSRFLLHRKDLEEVRRFRDQIRWGKEETDKRDFLRLSRRRETWRRLAVVAAGITAFGIVIGIGEFTRKREYQSLLSAWGLPPDLYDHLGQLEELTLPGTVTRLDWLRNAKRLKKLKIEDGVLESLEGVPASVESLEVGKSRLSQLSGIPDSLTSLTLGNARISEIRILPSTLGSLDLDLTNDPIFDLDALSFSLNELRLVLPAGFSQPDFRKLGSLQTLVLHAQGGTNFKHVPLPETLQSLSLNGIRIRDLHELPRSLRALTYLRTTFMVEERQSFAGLPKTLKHLEIELPRNRLALASEIQLISTLRSLRLHADLAFSQDLPPLPETVTSFEFIHRGSSFAVIRVQSLPKGLESVSFCCNVIFLSGNLPQGLKSLSVSGQPFFNVSEEDWLRVSSSQDPTFRHLPPESSKISLPLGLTMLDFPILPPGTKLPPSLIRLKTLSLPSALPAGLRSLDIRNDFFIQRALKLPSLPDGLQELNLRGVHVEALPGNLKSLASLDISFTPIDSLDGLPPSLRSLSLGVRQVETLEGLPGSVRTLHFHGVSSPDLHGPW